MAISNKDILPQLGLSSDDLHYSLEDIARTKANNQQAIREAIIEQRKAKKEKAVRLIHCEQADAILSMDFSQIADETFKKDFIDMCYEWERRVNLKYLRPEENVKAKCWFSFIKKWEGSFALLDNFIEYNDEHFCERNYYSSNVYISDEHRIMYRDNDGTFRVRMFEHDMFYSLDGTMDCKRCETTSGWSGDEIIKHYCDFVRYVAQKKAIDDFDTILWNALMIVEKNTMVESYLKRISKDSDYKNILSPYKIYQQLTLERNGYRRCQPFVKRPKKVFYEPGFEEEGRNNYKKYKRKAQWRALLDCLIAVRENGLEINEDNLQIYMLNRKGLSKQSELGFDNIKHRTLMKLYNEMMKDGQYRVLIVEGHLEIKWKRKEYKKQDTSVRKKQDTSIRKKQDRSEWHSLVKDGWSYEQILERYPNVTKNAYRTYKSRLGRSGES